MEKQTNPKPSGAPMAKMILVVAIIVSLGAALGVIGWVITNNPKMNLPSMITPTPTYEQCLKMESKISEDIDSLGSSCEIDSDCKTLIFSGNWRNICVNRDTDTTKVQSAAKSFSKKCPFPGVWPPIECSCIENKCTAIIEKGEDADETADWKIYRNEEYGFEVKYPLYEFFIIFPPETESILFNARTSSREFRLRIWNNSKKLSLEDYLMNVHYIGEIDPSSKEEIPSMLEKGQGKIANMEYFEGILGYPARFILKDQYIFEFLSNHYDKEFNQILSTFKFIEK